MIINQADFLSRQLPIQGGFPKPAVAYSSIDKTFLVVWQKKTAATTGIYGRLISADGAKMTSQFPISQVNSSYKKAPAVSYSPDSNKFLVVYQIGDTLYYNTVSGKPAGLP